MYFYRETSCFCYVINNFVNICNYHDIFIRVDDFIFHASYRYERDHLFDFQFKNVFQEIRSIIKRYFIFKIRKDIIFFRIKIRGISNFKNNIFSIAEIVIRFNNYIS